MKFLRLFFFIFIFSVLFFVFYLFAPTSLSSEKERFVIPLESRQDDIIAKLEKENFIRSPSLFSFLLTVTSPLKGIEPGSYMLSHNMTPFSLLDTLLNRPYQRWIVLVPGLRVEQISERLAKKFSWDEAKTKEFLNVAEEGYMFPDTYLLNADYTPKQVADRMISNFNDHFDSKLQKDLLALNEKWTTAIKVASLIERESGSDDDKNLISGIIWNRLNKDMPLQIDATIQYAQGSSANWWPYVTGSDLKVDSPYNTYLHKGLPPDPIASPSLASIKAAVYPDDTNCIFYLHDKNKQIHCAVTYDEHKENIEKYLR